MGSREPLQRNRKAARTEHPRFGRTQRRAPGTPNHFGGRESREKPRRRHDRQAARNCGPSGSRNRAGTTQRSSDQSKCAKAVFGPRRNCGFVRGWTRIANYPCHKERSLDVALRVGPLGPTLLREEAQVGSAVSRRFAAGRSREGDWLGCKDLTSRPACRAGGLRPGSRHRAHVKVHRALRRQDALNFGSERRIGTATTAWREQALDWQSPREHRALGRRKRRTDATDFTADKSPEVE